MTDRSNDDQSNDANSTDSGVSRRRFLQAGAATAAVAGVAPTMFTRNAWADREPIGNFPVKGKNVTFGFNVPKTGPYADEGADELRACKLAVKHLNEGGGMLETLAPSALTGQGVLGKKVDYVSGDTQTDPDAARTSARRMIERDKAVMFTGSSSSAVAIAQGYLAQELGVPYMTGLTHSNDTTGKDRRRYSFRHFFNSYMTGKALAPVIADAYGKDRRAFHLTADYTWGHTTYNSMKEFTEKEGWTTVNNIMTPLGSSDYSQFLTAVLNSDADVLVLNHYGGDMVNSLTQAVQFGMRDTQKNGKNLEIVVPLFSRLMASGAGAENIDGIFGSSAWNWTLQDEASQAFVKPFEAEYGFPPSQAAQTCYAQILLYANACEQAGTFYPPEVIKTLEDFEFSGTGGSDAIYRKDDHQCFKDMLVVQGKGPDKMEGDYDLLDVYQQVPRSDIMYSADHFKGELGTYKPA